MACLLLWGASHPLGRDGSRGRKMSLNVKSLALALTAFAAASGSLGGAALAAPITYNVNQTIGLGGVTGTIQTDGTIGTLATGNFTAWDLTLNGDGATYHITNADSVVLVVGTSATATATDISFNYSGGSGDFLLFQQGLFSGTHYWCNATTNGTCFQGASV